MKQDLAQAIFQELQPESTGDIKRSERKNGTLMISYDDFAKVDIRVGKIVAVEDFPQARKPAYKLSIYFGSEIGSKKSSVQITQNYTKDELLNTYVLGVVNFPPKQIGPFISECLTVGVDDEQGNVVLVRPDKDAKIGSKLY
jgi:tRNA-binding protein